MITSPNSNYSTLIFNFLSEFEVKLDQKNYLSISVLSVLFRTGINLRNFEQKVHKIMLDVLIGNTVLNLTIFIPNNFF
jgi:hypothetical protein